MSAERSPPPSADRVSRRRNKAQTRESILLAARTVFAQRGFGEVGVREITGLAGVNEALVSRYFGSKDRLFLEAVLSSGETLPSSIAVHRADAKQAMSIGPDTLSAIIRSAASEAVGPAIKIWLQNQALEPLRPFVSREQSEERAALIAAFFLGVHLLKEIIEIDALVVADARSLEQLSEAAICAICEAPAL